jgi:hypothetical protein
MPIPNTTFKKKDNPEIPDFFEITINYLTGRKEVLQVVSCQYFERLSDGIGQLLAEHFDSYEIWTTEDKMKVVPRASIESIDYDKNWSKMISLNKK